MIVIIYLTPHFVSTFPTLDSPSKFAYLLRNHIVLIIKDWYLKKMLLKEQTFFATLQVKIRLQTISGFKDSAI